METQVRTPNAIFGQPQRFLVPLFQRPYVWNEEQQWEPLWKDLERVRPHGCSGTLTPSTSRILLRRRSSGFSGRLRQVRRSADNRRIGQTSSR